uniref:Reverse transcriptase Ty1/copia-type domain-containing protein n=1 Tax=Vitis vinifera TaxID=29760 RepID=A5B421_VITVI|nr:hypothetical protein VITISV_019822 [Vitis vinifera]
MGLENDPISVSQVKQNFDSEKWIEAMKDEMKSMKDSGVWDLVELLEGIDYKETFSPVSSKDSFRIIMALMAHYDLELHQMDVKTVFLNGNIDETTCMVQLENFESNDSKQLVITSFGFKKNTVDQCVYLKFSGSKFIILVLYVDDILLSSSNVELLHETKQFLFSKFDMKDLGNAFFVLGIHIYKDRSRGILGQSQKSYIDKLRIVDGIEKPLRINYDNKAAEFYSKNNRSSSKSKHIDIKFLVVKERVQSLQVLIEHISTNSMIADPLTKGLPPKVYHEHVTHMAVVHIDDVLV